MSAANKKKVWGKIYTFYSARWSYLVAIFIFLIGSLVAALAPNSIALIVGRAIQGWGIAGTFSGSVLMINFVAPPQQRPMLIGSVCNHSLCPPLSAPIPSGREQVWSLHSGSRL
jgi:MFS family permease